MKTNLVNKSNLKRLDNGRIEWVPATIEEINAMMAACPLVEWVPVTKEEIKAIFKASQDLFMRQACKPNRNVNRLY